MEEIPVVFDCEHQQLIGIVHRPQQTDNQQQTGVIIVTGGHQYRVGSHRQFVQLARHLARLGYPVLRFDYTGMGDASGSRRGFDQVDADIRQAISTLLSASQVSQVILLGLCDAASACMIYSPSDPRVAGKILLNPWYFQAATEASAKAKQYYKKQLADVRLWRRLLSGQMNLRRSVAGLIRLLRPQSKAQKARHNNSSYQYRMKAGLSDFKGKSLLIYSEHDLTAAEFIGKTRMDRQWRKILRQDAVTCAEIPGADHTFTKPGMKKKLHCTVTEWIAAL